MSLSIHVDDPNTPRDAQDRHFMKPAGFEDYRKILWGTPAIAKRSPLLAEISTDLHLSPDQFSDFEKQCQIVEIQADDIVRELGSREIDSESIRRYMRNFLEALTFARQHKSDGIRIW